jgi:nicotinamide-nucleotide amidase
MAKSPGTTLAVAESLTVGRLQALIGSVSGASAYFVGGVTAYSLEAKIRLLKANRKRVSADNGVSAAVAEQMAAGVCRLFRADYGIATTGYAEAAPKAGIVAPFAWWAVCDATGAQPVAWSGCCEMEGFDREGVQEGIAEMALHALVEHLTRRVGPQKRRAAARR